MKRALFAGLCVLFLSPAAFATGGKKKAKKQAKQKCCTMTCCNKPQPPGCCYKP